MEKPGHGSIECLAWIDERGISSICLLAKAVPALRAASALGCLSPDSNEVSNGRPVPAGLDLANGIAISKEPLVHTNSDLELVFPVGFTNHDRLDGSPRSVWRLASLRPCQQEDNGPCKPFESQYFRLLSGTTHHVTDRVSDSRVAHSRN
jgi:hypothetical protein